MPDGFEGLDIKEVLDADSRPTFVIDLDPDLPPRDAVSIPIEPVFCNAALKLHERLLDSVLGNSTSTTCRDAKIDVSRSDQLPEGTSLTPVDNRVTHDEFKAWATGSTTHDDTKDVFPLSFYFQNLLWTGSTVRKRWRLISGNRQWKAQDQPPLNLSSGAPPEVATGGLRASLASKKSQNRLAPSTQGPVLPPELAAASENSRASMIEAGDDDHLSPVFYPRQSNSGGSVKTGMSKSSKNISINLAILPQRNAIDWTSPEPEGLLSTHLQYVRSVDWSATCLGPMDQWSSEFRQIANLVMANPHPAALFWGSNLVSTVFCTSNGGHLGPCRKAPGSARSRSCQFATLNICFRRTHFNELQY